MVITACRANSTGDAVNRSLMAYGVLSDSFSVLYRLIPGVAVSDVVTIVIVRVA